MTGYQLKRTYIEIVFVLMSIVLGVLIILPIINAGIKFDLVSYNFIFVVVSTTFIRWLIRWDLHPLTDSKIAKIVIICLTPMLFFPLLEGVHSFVEFRDQVGISSIMLHLSYDREQFYTQYLSNEYLFFAIGSLITSFLLIFKMLRSLWRQYKYGDKNKLKEG